MANITVPDLGESVSEATVAKWLKQAGETVNVDEPRVELETDKVTLDVTAPNAGVLSEITVNEGGNVEVGALLGKITEGAGATATPTAATTAAPSIELPKAPSAPVPSAAAAAGSNDALSPAVRKIVSEKNLDPSTIQGTGKDGRLTKGDVLGATPSKAKAPSAPREDSPRQDQPREERVRMSRLRQRIAERLKEAQETAAMLTPRV